MNKIGQHPLTNAGYISKLYLIPADQVAGILDPEYYPHATLANTVRSGGILIAPFTEIAVFRAIQKNISFSEASEKSVHGDLFRLQIDLSVPKPAAAEFFKVGEGISQDWIVVFEDNNQEVYVAGDPDIPVQFLYQAGGLDSYKFQLKCAARHAAWNLESMSPSVLFPHREFDYSFDFSFS